MDPIEELTRRLARHPELRFTATAASVEIEPPSSDGFSVGLFATAKEYVVHFDGWHEQFDSGDRALECVAFAYGGTCRLAITYRGRIPVRWVLEALKDGRWHADSEIGHFFVPFWYRARVLYRQNPRLLAPV
jgi:hypothetical protein